MKPMQDNEIDNLFRSSLEDYEIKPSAGSWKKVNSRVREERSGKQQPYWLAAASVVLIIGLGFRFFGAQQEVVIQLRGNHPEVVIVEEAHPEKNKITETKAPSPELSLEEVKIANEKRVRALLDHQTIANKKEIPFRENDVAAKTNFTSSFALEVEKDREEVGSENSNKINFVTHAIANDTELINDAKVIPAFHTSKSRPSEKSIIKSVGNLVNFVVDKMDNRENKFLHVSSTEESDMEITQINLGLVKYKKD